METTNIKNLYFRWLCHFIRRNKKMGLSNTYTKLLWYLFNKNFYWSIDRDYNRAQDGLDLRYRFEDENGYYNIDSYLPEECSVLEMMIALSIRCEEHIMDNPDEGDRTAKWFWGMITNLRLDSMSDDYFDEEATDHIIETFLSRKYQRDGLGGLFTVHKCTYDLRDIEIWYQMCWYLDDILGM